MGSMKRRTFLKQSASGLILLSTAGTFLTACKKYPQRSGHRFFSDKEYDIFRAIADRMIPPADGVPGAVAVGVPDTVDTLIAGFDPDIQSQVRQLLALFEHGTFLFGFKFHRFTELGAAEQDAYIGGWASSRLAVRRQGFMALKKFCMSVYYTHPASWPAIGYPGPAIG